MYHDSLLWRIIALGANERCLPVILVTSDIYYSYQAFMNFGFPDIYIHFSYYTSFYPLFLFFKLSPYYCL
ncbi:hypothetical protein SLA2020_010240 [Shorea laevis]